MSTRLKITISHVKNYKISPLNLGKILLVELFSILIVRNKSLQSTNQLHKYIQMPIFDHIYTQIILEPRQLERGDCGVIKVVANNVLVLEGDGPLELLRYEQWTVHSRRLPNPMWNDLVFWFPILPQVTDPDLPASCRKGPEDWSWGSDAPAAGLSAGAAAAGQHHVGVGAGCLS